MTLAANNFQMLNYPSQAPLLSVFPACSHTAENGGTSSTPMLSLIWEPALRVAQHPGPMMLYRLLGTNQAMPWEKTQCWLLVNSDRHLFDSCAGISWQARRWGQPGKFQSVNPKASSASKKCQRKKHVVDLNYL